MDEKGSTHNISGLANRLLAIMVNEGLDIDTAMLTAGTLLWGLAQQETPGCSEIHVCAQQITDDTLTLIVDAIPPEFSESEPDPETVH